MEHGMRHPSDRVLIEIADRLCLDSSELLLAAYCDRSPMLARVLETKGVEVEPGTVEGAEETTEPRRAAGPQGVIRAGGAVDEARLREQETPPPIVQVAYRF